MALLEPAPVVEALVPVPRLTATAPVPLAARRTTVPVLPAKISWPESRSKVPRLSVSTFRRLAPAPSLRVCGVFALPAPAEEPPMVRVPAVTTFWTLPRVTWTRAELTLSLLREMMMEPAAPAFRLTKVNADMSVVEVVATLIVLPPWPNTRVRVAPSPRFSVPAPVKVRLVVLEVFLVLPTVVLPVMVSERPAPMLMVLAVAEATWTFRLPNWALALARSRVTALALELELPSTKAPEPKLARIGAAGAYGELPSPATWKLIEPLSIVRFGFSAVVTRPERVSAAVPDLRRVPLPAIVPRKVLATLPPPTVTVTATGVPAVSWRERVPAPVRPTSWERA